MRYLLFCLALLAPLAPSAAEAQEGPISLSLFEPIQILDKNTSVHGFRLNIYGYNKNMLGVDIGLVNRVGGDFKGFQWLGVGWVEGSGLGVQWNYLANITKGKFEGFQWGVFNYSGDLTGLQLGFFDWSEGDFLGGQASAVNFAKSGTGFQLGAFNYSPKITGLQFGLVNYTEQLEGIQIGIVNIAKNGFLPVFVLFNFAF